MSVEILARYPGIGGRTLRIVVGLILAWIVMPAYTRSAPGVDYLLFANIGALLFLYLIMHFVLVFFAPPLKKWVAVLVGLVPVVAVYLFGGVAGEAGTLTFLALSLIVAGVRADTGCEVMAIPNLVWGKKSSLPCLVFSPLDTLEKKLAQSP